MLSDAVLKTLQYFDVQDRALSLLDIEQYLLADKSLGVISAGEIEKILHQLHGKVGSKYGFYFLADREQLAEKRLQNNFYAVQRLKRARRFLPLARFIPFIRAVALTGSEALSNSKQGSDIDLLVFTEQNRMWLGRLYITLFFQLLGLRRYGDKIENRFCLNHYLTIGKNIEQDKNLYTAIEYVSLIPFFGADVVYDFQQKNLDWIKEYLQQPQIFKYQTSPQSILPKIKETVLRNRFGDWLEKIVGNWQLKKIVIQEHIVVEEQELSFHPGSKGQQILKRFKS